MLYFSRETEKPELKIINGCIYSQSTELDYSTQYLKGLYKKRRDWYA